MYSLCPNSVSYTHLGFAEAKLLLAVEAPEDAKLRLYLAPDGKLMVMNEGAAEVSFQIDGTGYQAAPGQTIWLG